MYSLIAVAFVALVVVWLDSQPLGPHTVRCDGGELHDVGDLEAWVDCVYEDLCRKFETK